jgi:uncharacterized protein (DUF1501 family)
MKRKVFLRNTAQISLGTLLLGDALSSCQTRHNHTTDAPGRVLVLVQLDGGNDGLNTIIPINQYAHLSRARKNLLIPENKILPLNNTSITGMHPALGGLQRLYNNKQLCIVQGVGHAYPNLSHFKAFEIWNTCFDEAGSDVQTGWLGRYLDVAYPKSKHAHPPAIQTSAGLSQALQGSNYNAGVAVQTDSTYYELQNGHYGHTVNTTYGKHLSYVRNMIGESKDYLLKVKQATDAQKNLSNLYPAAGTNALADQLKMIAQLIGGGLGTRVYVANLGGFDTHAVAIEAFQDDLFKMGKQDEVIGMVYSEFGRRIISNGSLGCDHGTSAPVMFFGAKVKGGLIGHNPEIADKVGVEDNLAMQTDFRSVYATVLQNWFGVNDAQVSNMVLGKFPTLDIFSA